MPCSNTPEQVLLGYRKSHTFNVIFVGKAGMRTGDRKHDEKEERREDRWRGGYALSV